MDLIYALVLIIILVILIVVVFKVLNMLMVAPLAFAVTDDANKIVDLQQQCIQSGHDTTAASAVLAVPS